MVSTCSPWGLEVATRVTNILVSNILATRPRSFVLQQFLGNPRTTEMYAMLNPGYNCLLEWEGRCTSHYCNDDDSYGDWSSSICMSFTVTMGLDVFKEGGRYYIPLEDRVTISSSVETISPYENTNHTIHSETPLTIDLFCYNNLACEVRDLQFEDILIEGVTDCRNDLFYDKTLYSRVYNLFSIAIFSPLVLLGHTYICRPLSFRNLAGDTFTTETFAVPEGSNPQEIAMDEAARVMEIPKKEFYFVNPKDPIVLYHPTDSD